MGDVGESNSVLPFAFESCMVLWLYEVSLLQVVS